MDVTTTVVEAKSESIPNHWAAQFWEVQNLMLTVSLQQVEFQSPMAEINKTMVQNATIQ